VANGAFTQTRLARFSSRGAERAQVLIGVAAVLGLGGALVPYELAQLGLFAAGSALFLFGIFMTVIARKVRQAYDMTTVGRLYLMNWHNWACSPQDQRCFYSGSL